MKKTKLPKDLTLFSIKTALKRIVPCVLMLIAFAVALIFWGDVILPIQKEPVKTILYVIVMLVPFAVTGVPYKMLDRTYSGTVQKVEITTTVDNAYHSKPTRESLYYKNTVYLHVMQENGVVIRQKVSEKDARAAQNLEAYKVGDKVFHLYGSTQTIVLPEEKDELVQCAICGEANYKNECHCKLCNHTLILK